MRAKSPKAKMQQRWRNHVQELVKTKLAIMDRKYPSETILRMLKSHLEVMKSTPENKLKIQVQKSNARRKFIGDLLEPYIGRFRGPLQNFKKAPFTLGETREFVSERCFVHYNRFMEANYQFMNNAQYLYNFKKQFIDTMVLCFAFPYGTYALLCAHDDDVVCSISSVP